MDISARPPGTARRCRRTSRPPRSPWRGRARCWTRSAPRGRGVRSSPSSRHHSPRCSVRCTQPRARPEGLACFRSRRRRDPRARDRRPPGLAPSSSPTVRPVSHSTPRRLLTPRRRRGVPGRWPEPWCGERCAAAGRGAGRCSTSAGPVGGGRPTVGSAAARPRNAVNGGTRPPSMGLGEQWNRKYGRRLDLGPPE